MSLVNTLVSRLDGDMDPSLRWDDGSNINSLQRKRAFFFVELDYAHF